MPLPHGTVKSGQSRNTNMMGATNTMIRFMERNRSKPVSINYLRVMLKNLNRSIPTLSGEPQRQMALISQKQRVYNLIKLFQTAYANGDYSASAARSYARMNNIPLLGDATPTMRQTRDGVQRVADMLGAGSFDQHGMHVVSKDGKPRIPGGYNTGDKELIGAEIDKKDASVVFSPKDVPLTAKLAAHEEFQGYLQRTLRGERGYGTMRVNGRDKRVAGEYQRNTRGTRNTFVDRSTGEVVVIPNGKVIRDGKRTR